MNAPVITEFLPAQGVDQSEIDRLTLRIIRCFAELDFEIERWLSECGKGDPKQSSGHRLKALASHCDALKATQRQRNQIQQLSAYLSDALNVRNALVHGRIQTGLIGSQPYLFATTLDQEFGVTALKHCFTKGEIEAAIAQVDKMRSGLHTWRAQRGATVETDLPTSSTAS